jgi:Domain of unknown function (DUF4062)
MPIGQGVGRVLRDSAAKLVVVDLRDSSADTSSTPCSAWPSISSAPTFVENSGPTRPRDTMGLRDKGMNIDLTAAARRADPEQARAWLADQPVLISSAMADTVDERRAVAEIVEDEGARPVLFEDLGRDAGAGEAYLTGVDSSTIYVAVLNEIYGTMLETVWGAQIRFRLQIRG